MDRERAYAGTLFGRDLPLLAIICLAGVAGLDLSPWPQLGEHTNRVRARPSFERALARERAALTANAIDLPPGMVL